MTTSEQRSRAQISRSSTARRNRCVIDLALGSGANSSLVRAIWLHERCVFDGLKANLLFGLDAKRSAPVRRLVDVFAAALVLSLLSSGWQREPVS